MIGFLASLIPAEVFVAIGGLITTVLALLVGRRQGAKNNEVKHLKRAIEKGKEARDARSQEERDTDGLSDSDVIDRVHGRDADWDRL